MENMKRLLTVLTVVAMLLAMSGFAEEGALALDQTSVTMDYSQTVTLTAANGGESARWTSSDEGVVRLGANRGESVEIVGISAGAATITCTSGEQQQSCEVMVTAPGTLEIVNVDYPSTYRMAGRGWKLRRGVLASSVDLATLTTVLKDANGTIIGSSYTHTFERGVRRYEINGLDNYVPFSWIRAEGAYTWTLSATDVSGRMVAVNLPISAVAEGETAISNDPGAQSPVIVVTEIALDSAEIEMLKDETRQLTATVTPGGAMNSGVIWVSDDPSVAVVSADGLVTGTGIGTATITCKTLGDSGISASCAVTVLAEPAAEEGEVGTPGDGRNLISGTATPVELAPRDTGEATDNYNYAVYTFTVGRLTQGETYCLSADVEVTAGAVDGVSILVYDAATSVAQAAGQTIPVVEGHTTTTIEITGADAEKLLIYAGASGATRGNGMRISNLKLECGSEPTGWTPAPEDGDGRNLIFGTATPVELVPRDTGEATDNYNYAVYTFTVGKLVQGETYCVSADMDVTAGAVDGVSVIIYDSATSASQAEGQTVPIVDGHITATFEITGADAEELLIYAGPSGETRGNGIRISNLKLERGTTPTAWTPAPEDDVE